MYSIIANLFHDGAPVTFFIMLTVLICGIITLANRAIFFKLILHPFSIVKHKEYYRLITSDFVHNDWLHLLLNEFMLYLSCASLEETLRKRSLYGSWQFVIIYLSSYFLGVIVSTARNYKNFEFSSAGASGSIMGCMISYMILQPYSIAFYLPVIGGVPDIYAALIYIIGFIVYQWRSENPYVNCIFRRN